MVPVESQVVEEHSVIRRVYEKLREESDKSAESAEAGGGAHRGSLAARVETR
jgi:hypothetical protein